MNGKLKVNIGKVQGVLIGGPYKAKPMKMLGIKMAAEIQASHSVSVPTEDFNVPTLEDLTTGIVSGLMLLRQSSELYVGCMGGIGRTGLYLAAIRKVQLAVEFGWTKKTLDQDRLGQQAIIQVRAEYLPSAVETKQQQEYIRKLDVVPIIGALWMLNIV